MNKNEVNMLVCRICGYQNNKSILSHVRNKHHMTAKEYRAKYNEPLRKAYEHSDETFRKLGRRNSELMKGEKGRASLPDGKWSRKYDKCVECGCIDYKHVSNGKCKKCYARQQQKEIVAKKNDNILKIGEENIDYVMCRICNKPFGYLSSNGHLKVHKITLRDYKVMFPDAPIISVNVSKKRSQNISKARKKIMASRGYLNPSSQRQKKRKEMVYRHSQKDFAKVSGIEESVSEWLKKQRINVEWWEEGKNNIIKDNVIYRQYIVDDKFCVDFADVENKIIIEVLGNWWHGWKFLNNEEEYDKLHPQVKKNLKLDKLRFKYFKENNWSLIKLWEHDIKDNNIGSVLPMYYNQKDDNILSLSDIVKSPNERWNARYLMVTGRVQSLKGSKFTQEQAKILRERLDQHGEESAIPKEDVSRYFKEARINGFPYYDISEKKFIKGINSLIKADVMPKEGLYNWVGNGSELASFFHPHMFECRSKGQMSAIEFYNSDEDFKRGIWKLLGLYGKITRSNLREICRNEKASSRINQFPPRVAMSIIKDLYPNGNIKYLDPTHGFSGRLIGAYCSRLISKYVGIDLSTETHQGAKKTVEWMENLLDLNMEVELIKGDCLKIMPEIDDYFDLILTSPPFLDIEQYKDVPFETDYNAWLESFIRPFCEISWDKLKSKGKMAVYLEKIKGHDFREDFKQIAIESKFINCPPVLFKMSYGENNRDKNRARGVPILVFEK